MPDDLTPERRTATFWLVVLLLAVVGLALGIWDLAFERDGQADWMMQAALPLLLLIVAGWMYWRHKRGSSED